MLLRLSILLLSLVIPFGSGAAIPRRRATVCNGREELCGRHYSDITYIGAHNSFGADKNPFALARNQEIDVSKQLAVGVRLLQGQAHTKDGGLNFCHTSCDLFDGGSVENYLKKVKTFLDANPYEVLTLIFTNPEGVAVGGAWKAAFDNAGITPLAYVPPQLPMKHSDWPTLGEMLNTGKRVVVFMDANADTAQVDFILPEFEMIWETPFSVTDASFPCAVDRVQGPLSTEDHMYMINHSLNKELPFDIIIPDFTEASTTNGAASITAHVDGCTPLGGNRKPNFILLDWIGIGDAFKVADQLNGFV